MLGVLVIVVVVVVVLLVVICGFSWGGFFASLEFGCGESYKTARGCYVLAQKIAMQKLQAKLVVVMQEQQLAHVSELRGEMVKADFGQQIRNYVMHPYKLVKDLRTGMETSDVSRVLDGSLDSFIQAFLQQKSSSASQALASP